MKIRKCVPAVILLSILLLAFSGCDLLIQQNDTRKEYDKLNAMLKSDYSQISLTVTNEFEEDVTLISEYKMEFSDGGVTVNYRVERFSSLSLDSTVPAKTELVGKATVSDGKVNYISGEEVNLDAVTASFGLKFKEEYFDNVELTGVCLIADVVNPQVFMGSPLTCTGMKVKATFLEVFYDIKISYLAQNGSRVEYLYNFTV